MNDTEKAETTLAHTLVAALAHRLRETLRSDGTTPASVLEWLASQPAETISRAITATQPKGWDAGASLLVDSLTPDQRIGVLAALVAVWVQAQ